MVESMRKILMKKQDGLEEAGYVLSKLVTRPKSKFLYEYDFGDGWQHELLVESINDVPTDQLACLECIEGSRACPPEDAGGI